MRTFALVLFFCLGVALAANPQSAQPQAQSAKRVDALYYTQENLLVNGQVKTTTYLQRIPVGSLEELNRLTRLIDQPARQGGWEFDAARKSWILRDEVGLAVAPRRARELYQRALSTGQREFYLPVAYTQPGRGALYHYRIGIRQMLAEATTSFGGSSRERAYNIWLGARKLNGQIVAPGQVFSFSARMGDVSLATGFRNAFVISGERTVEGVGGGMCQVSTTLFRSAYFSGLPIVARRPHSYQVRYYLPTGLDAAVFLPQLDLRFRNDTPGHIMIQSYVGRGRITFRIFGTKDRSVSWTNPVVSRVIPAPATRFIVTDQLPRQAFRQVDWAAQGAVVNVYRTVRHSDGRTVRDTLTSNYKPWGAVWMVGPGTRLRDGRVLYATNDDAADDHGYQLPTQTASR
ncbi:MAG: VanW family protein [Meiothermus sp.]|nr:VanW family protein [Meiothermus sp.]